MSQTTKNQRNATEELERMKEEYQNVTADKDIREKLLKRMLKAKADKKAKKKAKIMKFAVAVAASLGILLVIPNSSASAANAMGVLPVVGRLFQVITFRNYKVEGDNYYADVNVPEIQTETDDTLAIEPDMSMQEAEGDQDKTTTTQESLDEGKDSSADMSEAGNTAQEIVNKSVDEYVGELIARFEQDIQQNENAHQGLDVTYDVLMNTDSWFTLRINVVETAASGYEYSRIYHINKELDQVVELKDLFAEGSSYVDVISDYIKDEMRRQMKESEDVSYFIDSEPAFAEDDFKNIREDQNYYFNADGQLVIVFDEYEVAPGFMGAVEFVIPDAVVSDIMIQRP